MAWTKDSVNRNNFLVATETLTLPDGAATAVNSSSIDFLKKGQDFLVVVNTGAVNTTADGDVDVQVSYDGTTWVTLKADLIASFDSAVVVANYDVSSYGEAPYYRIQLTSDGNQAEEEIVVKIIQ